MYVDYEGLLVDLSHFQSLDIEVVLADLLKKASQQYAIQDAIVLGTWLQQASRDRLTHLGYLCRSVFGTEQEITYEIQISIIRSLEAQSAEAKNRADHTDVFILVGGTSDRAELIRQVRQAERSCILWTLTPPSPTEQALCSVWEPIHYPHAAVNWIWPRQAILHELILVADHLQNEEETTFSLSALHNQLSQCKLFKQEAYLWIAISIREQIVLLKQTGGDLQVTSGFLNLHHSVVRKTLFIKVRVLMTLSAMLTQRDWVAFSALEKALSTARALVGSQNYRHAWLEILVDLGILLTRPVPHPNKSYTVTTLSFNQEHQVVATLHKQQKRNLQRAVIIINNFLARKGYHAINTARLLHILMKNMTYIEAHATLKAALEQEIAHNDGTPSAPISSPIAVRLNESHPFVVTTLDQRDMFIRCTEAIFTQRNEQVNESMLSQALSDACQVGEDETLFWIWLFIDEGILARNHTGSIAMLSMKRLDAVVKQALNN
ncbi:hypothetical protein KSF_066610 [Reticulibacter mediterranei]|uniref:Uncharacterized protein n=2 Tax=Reticulibacter mediterranei TaxID=2778369 RepID=A0A8J3IQ78_9CHLR|nr:hypothetical protein KSF_066610 [Reticulibacter mediterranei]